MCLKRDFMYSDSTGGPSTVCHRVSLLLCYDMSAPERPYALFIVIGHSILLSHQNTKIPAKVAGPA